MSVATTLGWEFEDTAWNFVRDVVRPNVADFEATSGSLRHAFNAVMAVDALAGYVHAWREGAIPDSASGDDTQYRDFLAQRNPAFALFRDIAKAQKHFLLTRGMPMIKSAEDVKLLVVPPDHTLILQGDGGIPIAFQPHSGGESDHVLVVRHRESDLSLLCIVQSALNVSKENCTVSVSS